MSNLFDEMMADLEREDAQRSASDPFASTDNLFDVYFRKPESAATTPVQPSFARRALDVGQGVLNVAGAGGGAIAGALTGLLGSDAYGRALEENLAARGPAESTDVGFFEALRAAPGAGQVLAEAALPGEQQTAAGRIAKRVGGLVGDIAGDPANWVGGGLLGAAGKLDDATLAAMRNRELLFGAAQATPRVGTAVERAARGFGSAAAGAVYLPEVVQGTYGAIQAAQADPERAGEHWTEAALMGGLGTAALLGVRREAKDLRAAPSRITDAGAVRDTTPDFEQEFAPPPAPSRVNWTPEQEALYRDAFNRQQAAAPVLDRDFFTEPGRRDTFGDLLAEISKNNPTTVPEPPPVTLPAGYRQPDVWSGPVPPGFEAPGTPTEALLTDLGAPAGPPRLTGGPGVRMSPQAVQAGERAAFEEAAPIPYTPPPVEPEVLPPPVTDRDFLASEAAGLLGGPVVDVSGRAVVPELPPATPDMAALIDQRLAQLAGRAEPPAIPGPPERAALPSAPERGLLPEGPDPLTAALEAALSRPAGPPRLAPRPEMSAVRPEVPTLPGRTVPEEGAPVQPPPVSTQRGQPQNPWIGKAVIGGRGLGGVGRVIELREPTWTGGPRIAIVEGRDGRRVEIPEYELEHAPDVQSEPVSTERGQPPILDTPRYAPGEAPKGQPPLDENGVPVYPQFAHLSSAERQGLLNAANEYAANAAELTKQIPPRKAGMGGDLSTPPEYREAVFQAPIRSHLHGTPLEPLIGKYSPKQIVDALKRDKNNKIEQEALALVEGDQRAQQYARDIEAQRTAPEQPDLEPQFATGPGEAERYRADMLGYAASLYGETGEPGTRGHYNEKSGDQWIIHRGPEGRPLGVAVINGDGLFTDWAGDTVGAGAVVRHIVKSGQPVRVDRNALSPYSVEAIKSVLARKNSPLARRVAAALGLDTEAPGGVPSTRGAEGRPAVGPPGASRGGEPSAGVGLRTGADEAAQPAEGPGFAADRTPAPAPEELGEPPSRPKFATKPAPGFFSQLRKVVDDKRTQAAATGEQWARFLADPKRAVKADELKWTGLDDFLASKKGQRVTKDEIARFLDDAAASRWHTTTKPQGIRELGDDVLGPEMAAAMSLEPMDGGVLSVLKHDQIRRSVVSLLPVDVVDILSRAQVSPEDLLRNPKVVFSDLPADGRSRVALGVRSALRKAATAIRAELGGLAATRADVEVLPTLKASDLSPREVASLLDPQRLFHPEAGGRPKESTATGARAEAPPRSEAGVGDDKLAFAELADGLNAHGEIIHGRGESLQQAPGQSRSLPGITAKEVKRAFAAGEVRDVGEGAWEVSLPGDRKITVRVRPDGIEYDAAAFSKGYGREKGAAEEIVGSWQKVGKGGLVFLSKQADQGTVDHEAFHAAMDLALSPREKAAVLKKFGDEEKAAEAYAKWQPGKQVNGYFAKILRFFRNLYRTFRPSWESTFERTRSGEAYGKPKHNLTPAAREAYAAKRPEFPKRRELVPDAEDFDVDPAFTLDRDTDWTGGHVTRFVGEQGWRVAKGQDYSERIYQSENEARAYLAEAEDFAARNPNWFQKDNVRDFPRSQASKDRLAALWEQKRDAQQRLDAASGDAKVPIYDEVRRIEDAIIAEERGRTAYATRPAPGQRGLPGFGEDVAQPGERKRGPEQQSMFGGEMLQGVERRGTEGREAEGPLFTQEAEARAKAEDEAQGTLPKYATAPTQPPQMPPQRPRPTAVPPQAQPARAFSLPEETFVQKAQRYVQDRLNRLGVVQESIRQQGGRVREDLKAAADALSPKVAERFRDLDEKIVNPLTKALSEDKLSLKDLDQYLYARHAPTRNAVIAQRNPGVADGSGMSDADAARILADFQTRGLTPALQRAEAFIRQARDEQIRVLLDGGLISQAQATSWKNTMGDEYVPLRSVEVDEGIGTGSGFDIRGKEAKSATGRSSLADSPTSAMLQQLQRAIVRAEKNKVDQKFAEFVRDNGLFEMDKAHTRRELDAQGQVRDVRDTLRDAEDFSYKVNGERHRIDIASKDPLLDRAMKNLSAKETGEFVQRIGNLTRLYSQMVTSWNPEFVATNFARDIQTALANVSAEQSGKIAATMAKNVPQAMKAMYKSLRSPSATPTGWEQVAKEFREDGGSVGWYSVKDIPALEKSLQTKIKLSGPGALNRARSLAKGLGTLVEDVNKTVESGTRLALYKALRDSGVSREKAASTARNVTIDFNKKGEMGPAMNALYAFFNANIQGGKRLADVVTTKRGAAVAGGVAGIAFALDQYNRAVAEDSNGDGTNDYDDVPEYVKERNLVIMRGKGEKPLLIPMPYGFNVIYTAGRQAAALTAGAVKPGEAALNTGSALVNAFNPLGSESNLVQILSPTALDPLVQDVMNKDFAGRNIRPEQFPTETKKPDSELYFKNVSPVARELAKLLNEKTGGDKVTPGLIDVSPETMQHYWEFATGGLGRFAGNTAATVGSLAEGETPSVRNLPFARRFVYEASPGLTGQKYRKNSDELDQLMTRYKTYVKERNRTKLAEIPRPMIRAAQKFEFIERQIRQIRKAEKEGRIRNAEARIESLRRLGNRIYAQASEEAS